MNLEKVLMFCDYKCAWLSRSDPYLFGRSGDASRVSVVIYFSILRSFL